MNIIYTRLSKLNVLESWLIGISLAFCVLGFTGLFLFFQEYQEKMYPGVFVVTTNTKNSISLAGLTKPQAQKIIENTFTLNTDNAIFFTSQENASYSASLSQIGLKYETQKAVEEAFKIGRNGNFLTRIFSVLNLQFRPNFVELEITIQPEMFSKALGEPLQQKVYIEPATPSARLGKTGNATSLTIEPGKLGRFFDETVAREIIRKAILMDEDENSNSIDISDAVFESGYVLNEDQVQLARERATRIINKSLILTGSVQHNEKTEKSRTVSKELLDKDIIPLLSFKNLTNNESDQLKADKLEELLNNWQTELSTPVQEPELEIDTESKKVIKFVPPVNGIKLDIEQTKQIIENSVVNMIASNLENGETQKDQENQKNQSNQFAAELPLQVAYPNKPLGELNTLGIVELIGYGESQYAGSIPNRAFNVNLTANKITNTLVAPGEEFSFNKTLGEVSARTGFRSAYVIKNGRTELGDGGGVCQVSTTVFRAALDAGLDITRRLQHSYRVGYYEQNSKPGLDATVYSGNVDFRFRNDTNHYILIHNVVDQDKMAMTTQIFGTSDGRKSELISHEVWDAVPAPAPQFFPDASLAPGQRVQIDWAVGGVKTRAVNKITYSDGTIKETEYYSNYRPWSAKYLVGM